MLLLYAGAVFVVAEVVWGIGGRGWDCEFVVVVVVVVVVGAAAVGVLGE